MKTVAIVVGAGAGQRMGGKCKALIELDGTPLICYSLDLFQESDLVDGIAVAVPPGRVDEFGRCFGERGNYPKVFAWVGGGACRQDSVAAALQAVPGGVSWILIHDVARPFVSGELLKGLMAAAAATGAAVPGREPTDTIKEVSDSGRVLKTLERRHLRAVQTPQLFRAGLLRRAYREAGRDGVEATDDASLVERLGHEVTVIEGSCDNIKITVPGDMERARNILRKIKSNRMNAD